MKISRKTLAILFVSASTISSSAFAQDVVMRRPLPVAAIGSGQNNCDPSDPDCSSNPNPTDPGGTEVPGLDSDNNDIYDPGESLPDGTMYVSWEAGQWEGAAQCGQSSTLHRQVRCVAYYMGGDDGGGPMVLGRLDGNGDVSQASYGSYGDKAKVVKAQFLGDEDLSTQYVSPEYCVNDVGPPPPSVYTGTKAGCSYSSSVSLGEWQEPYGGSPTCSSSAFRERTVVCRDTETNNIVAPRYCQLALTDGGLEDPSMFEPEYGNFAGCTANWEASGWNVGCKPTGSPNSTQQGPVYYSYQEYQCVRSDGTVLTGMDEVSCTGSRPSDGYYATGSCSQTFLALGGKVCLGVKQLKMPATYGDYRDMYEGGGAEACLAAGVSCCQAQIADYGEGYVPQIVGTTNPPVNNQYGYYWDYDAMKTCYATTHYPADGPPVYSDPYPCEDEAGMRYGNGGSGKEWQRDN